MGVLIWWDSHSGCFVKDHANCNGNQGWLPCKTKRRFIDR
jgi:hypothetical protein